MCGKIGFAIELSMQIDNVDTNPRSGGSTVFILSGGCSSSLDEWVKPAKRT